MFLGVPDSSFLKIDYILKFTVIIKVGTKLTPNLSTMLSTSAIQPKKFEKIFEEYSKGLPSYFKSVLYICVLADKNLTVFFKFLKLGYLFRLVSSKENYSYQTAGGFIPKIYNYVTLKNFYKVIFLKFGIINNSTLKQGLGTLINMDFFLRSK